jgi:hypothetical protein
MEFAERGKLTSTDSLRQRFQEAPDPGTKLPQLIKVGGRESLDLALTSGREAHLDTAPIRMRGSPADETLPGQPVDETHGAVMAQLQPLRQVADRHVVPPAEPLDRQQGLVLLRGEPAGKRRVPAEPLEPPQRMAQFRQELIVGLGDARARHRDGNLEGLKHGRTKGP